jgi:hypothetical protein
MLTVLYELFRSPLALATVLAIRQHDDDVLFRFACSVISICLYPGYGRRRRQLISFSTLSNTIYCFTQTRGKAIALVPSHTLHRFETVQEIS